METTANKNTSTILHLSALTQYFIPLGNFIFPALIWSLKKNDSEFVDHNGKQAINFQLSLFLYSFILVIIAASIFAYMVLSAIDINVQTDGDWIMEQFSLGKLTGLALVAVVSACLIIGIKVAELFLILYASVKSNNGERFNFPLTIKFIR